MITNRKGMIKSFNKNQIENGSIFPKLIFTETEKSLSISYLLLKSLLEELIDSLAFLYLLEDLFNRTIIYVTPNSLLNVGLLCCESFQYLMSFMLVLTEIIERDLYEKELELRYKRGRLDFTL